MLANLTATRLAGILDNAMNTSTIDQQAEPVEAIEPTGQKLQRRAPIRRSRLTLGLLICILLVLAWLLAPWLLWAYDVEQAGRLMDRGMVWPEPRTDTSLPENHDPQALDQALVYLANAIDRRPEHPHAYHLAGQIYAARADWERATASFERAHAVAPRNPLYAWEASLIYERMWQAVERAPREPLMDTMAAGHLIAPGQLVNSLFCSDKGAESCYFGRGAYTQPYAAFPSQAAVSMPVLFLHPPASLEQPVAIPPDRPALHFAIGLDPVAREWRTDGAAFRVWVRPANRPRQLAAELTIDRAKALSGWALGWADLTPWAGQTVTLELESHPGPTGDINDDWYGWGDLALTTRDAARYAALLPEQRMRQARGGIR
jgi:tetratricopeptide (TPR) repeat protein